MREAKPRVTGDTDRERNARLLKICTTHPEVRDRVLQILTLLEEDGGGVKRVDDAELRVVEELKKLGADILSGWGQQVANREAQRRQVDAGVVKQVKKTPLV